MDESRIVEIFGAALRVYSYDIRNARVLGPFIGLMTGDAMVTCTLKGDKVFFKKAMVSASEVTGLAEKNESLQAEVKELKKTVKAFEAEKVEVKEETIVLDTDTDNIPDLTSDTVILDPSDTPKPTTDVMSKLKPRRSKK